MRRKLEIRTPKELKREDRELARVIASRHGALHRELLKQGFTRAESLKLLELQVQYDLRPPGWPLWAEED